jgi:hypothetical protein
MTGHETRRAIKCDLRWAETGETPAMHAPMQICMPRCTHVARVGKAAQRLRWKERFFFLATTSSQLESRPYLGMPNNRREAKPRSPTVTREKSPTGAEEPDEPAQQQL